MELHAPARVAEPERLRARGAARELDGARRHAVGVVVPLQRLEARAAERRATGSSAAASVSSTPHQPISGPSGIRPTQRAGRAREQLHAEADAEHRRVPVEQLLQPERLLAQPRMVRVLVGVHRAAEHEHRVVRVERARRRRAPAERPLVEPVPRLLDDGREELGSRVRAVDHREDVHRLGL